MNRRALLWLSLAALLLKLVCVTWRLPLFPLWVPGLLLLESSLGWGALAMVAAGALTTALSGTASLDFSIALLSLPALSAVRARAPWLWKGRIAVAAVLWTVLSAARHHLPGSLPVESFFTAAFAKALPDLPAGLLARLLLVALVVGLAGAARRWLMVTPRRAATALAVCAAAAVVALVPFPARTAAAAPFVPSTAPASIAFFTEDAGVPVRHPVLPEASRKRVVCIACHMDKVTPSDKPVPAKNFHEVHFAFVKLEVECTFCHVHAGEAGFPDVTGSGDRRTEYKARCHDCHVDQADAAHLGWDGGYR